HWLQLRRKRRIQLPSGSRRVFEDGVVERHRRVPGEWLEAGGHFVEHQAERKQVRAYIQLLTPYLLRRHVACRSHRHPGSAEEQMRVRPRQGLWRCSQGHVLWMVPSLNNAGIRFRRNQLCQPEIEYLGL